MKKTSFLVLLLLSMMVVALSLELVLAETSDPVIVGKWDRTDGSDKYTIYANGVTETVLPDGTHHGTWAMDGSSGYKYIFRWDFGPSGQASFVDYVTVAADGQSYSGVNNYGDDFHCVRVGDASAAESGGFPIVYVAVGGGIAAIAAVGVAVYFLFFAGGSAASAGASAGTPEVTGAANGGGSGSEGGGQNNSGDSSLIAQTDAAEEFLKRARIDDRIDTEFGGKPTLEEGQSGEAEPSGESDSDEGPPETGIA